MFSREILAAYVPIWKLLRHRESSFLLALKLWNAIDFLRSILKLPSGCVAHTTNLKFFSAVIFLRGSLIVALRLVQIPRKLGRPSKVVKAVTYKMTTCIMEIELKKLKDRVNNYRS